MSALSAIFNNKIYNFEQAFGIKDITTAEMKRAIDDWYGLYYMTNASNKEDPCQRIPVAIINKLTKTTFSEYSATISKKGTKDEYLKSVLKSFNKSRKKATQQALIGGQCFLKPIFTSYGIDFSVIERRNYLVLGRNERDEITDIGTAERTAVDKFYYTLLERRTVNSNGYLTIESRLYRSNSKDMLGTQVELSELDKYAALEPVNTLPLPLYSLGLIPLQTPLANCVDGSPDPVSAYAPATRLIHLININEAQINGEFERGQSRIIVSGDMMTMDENGERRALCDNVFTAIDDMPENVGITIFSPAFREQSFLARKTEYLRNCETLIGLKRGILSEVEAVERTAKEITSSEGDYNLTIIDFQQMWEKAVREAVRVCDLLGQMYRVCDSSPVAPDNDVIVSWGNGILYDEDKVWAEYTNMVASGMLKPEIALAWYFNLPWETPKDLAAIREKYMPELERLMNGE